MQLYSEVLKYPSLVSLSLAKSNYLFLYALSSSCCAQRFLYFKLISSLPPTESCTTFLDYVLTYFLFPLCLGLTQIIDYLDHSSVSRALFTYIVSGMDTEHFLAWNLNFHMWHEVKLAPDISHNKKDDRRYGHLVHANYVWFSDGKLFPEIKRLSWSFSFI